MTALSSLVLVFGAATAPVAADPPIPVMVAPTAADPPQGREAQGAFEVAFVRIEGLDPSALISALALRLPAVELQTDWDFSQRPAPTQRHVFLRFRREGGDAQGRVELGVVTSEGDAYGRLLPAEDVEPRVVSSTAANLVVSVERDALRANVEGVEIPETSEAPVEAEIPVVEIEPEPELGAEPESESEPAATLRPTVAPDPQATPSPESAASPFMRRAGNSPWTLAVVFVPTVSVPVGPPEFAPGLGAGAQLSAGVTAPNDWVVGVDVRYLGRRGVESRLSRFRTAVGAGYRIRRGSLQLPILGGISVEGWTLRDEESRVAPADIGAPGALLGFFLRASPSFEVLLRRPGIRALRLGGSLELAGGFAFDDGPTVVGIGRGEVSSGEEIEPLFRVGGAELQLGLEFAVDFGLGR